MDAAPQPVSYRGVAQILAYNRAFYVGTAVAITIVFLVSFWLPGPLKLAALTGAALALVWSFVSLAVSHYVYDRSGIYRFEWLTMQPDHWINMHAGLDETTSSLRARFPSATYLVFDIFDPQEMTEPSIARAREVNSNPHSHAVSWRRLPVPSRTADAVFLVFAAHELRRPQPRQAFFQEVGRVLAPGGRAFVMEHLRDVPNFLAYGPGFLHFHARRSWLATFAAAGLRIVCERRLNPWVRLFELSSDQ